ncbi:hypothetical protein DFH09DRAFT_1098066 [Mycena vulgaris]|nr:hypothetical protein DFH09DRAFT_1098066 [Mycena vulgaris]
MKFHTIHALASPRNFSRSPWTSRCWRRTHRPAVYSAPGYGELREGDEVMPSIWLPDGILPGFKETCLEFFWLCHAVQLDILRALAVGFGLPEENFFKVHRSQRVSVMLRHLSVPVEALHTDKIARIGEHSDFGPITLLLQDDVGGLEAEDPRVPGSFRLVLSRPPVPGALIVNAGDFMMLSNDAIRSTIHRARVPPSPMHIDGMRPERYSIPYFCCAAQKYIMKHMAVTC